MRLRKHIILLIVLLVISAFFYIGVWPFIVGGGRMQDFCDGITAGLSFDEVKTRAEQKGYKASRNENRVLIIDNSAMGRFICDVQFNDGRVTAASYMFND